MNTIEEATYYYHAAVAKVIKEGGRMAASEQFHGSVTRIALHLHKRSDTPCDLRSRFDKLK